MLVYDPDQRATPTELLQHPYILSVPESALTTPAVVANSTVAGDMAIVDETGATKALNSDNIQSRKRVAPDNSEENAAMQVDDQSSANSSMHNQKNSRLDDQIVPESSNVGSEMDSKNDTWSSSNIHKLR